MIVIKYGIEIHKINALLILMSWVYFFLKTKVIKVLAKILRFTYFHLIDFMNILRKRCTWIAMNIIKECKPRILYEKFTIWVKLIKNNRINIEI